MARPKTRKIEKIAVEKIAEPSFMVRTEDIHSAEIQQLAKSILVNGQIEPIIVKAVDDHYVLVVGWRRLQACKYAELPFIDGEVRDIDEESMIKIRWAENEDRMQVNPADECAFVAEVKALTQKTQKEVAEMLGKTEGYVSQRLAVNDGYPSVLEALHKKEISFGQARELIKYPNEETAKRYMHLCKDGGASPDMLRRWRADEEVNQQVPEEEREEVLPGPTEQFQEPTFFCECCRHQKFMSDINYLKLCPMCKADVIEATIEAEKLKAGEQ